MTKRKRIGLGLMVLASPLLLLLAPVRSAVFSAGPSLETRGWRVAQAQGCFHCHGPEARGGVPNPGVGKIPGLADFGFLMSVHSQAELLAWILDGAPKEEREKRDYAEGRKQRVAMPAYRGRLSEGELTALLAWYHVSAGTVYPREEAAQKGYEVAAKKGCFSCHGVGGRLDLPNPGSLTGRIPAWHGEDFQELARDEAEVRDWIMKGGVARLNENPMARFFLDRQLLSMPAYEGRLNPAELEAILAYIRWLRDPNQAGHEPHFVTPFTQVEDLGDYGVGDFN